MIHISFPLDKQSFDIQFMRVWIHQRMINWVIKKETRTITVRIIFGDEESKAKNSFLVNALSKEYDSEPTCNKKCIIKNQKSTIFLKRALLQFFYERIFGLIVKLQIRMDGQQVQKIISCRKYCNFWILIYIFSTYIEKFHKKV